MAVDYFLKLEGIDGESTDDKHKGWIDITSFSFGATQQTSWGSGTGGGGAGKVSVSDFHITKKTDKASTPLFVKCATGEHIATAKIVCREAGGDAVEFFKFTLTDVLVSGIQFSGSHSGDRGDESVSISAGKVELDYKPQDEKGRAGASVTGGWDLKTNKKV
jgi:type VI secretion system secreted protein Hcp